MKIVFAGHDGAHDISGVSSWLIRLLPLLRGAGHEVEAHLFQVDTGEGEGATTRLLRQEAVLCRCAPWPKHTAAGADTCIDWLLASRPDVYVPNCIVPAYAASAVARAAGALTIGVLHSDDPFYDGLLETYVAGEAPWRLDAVVAVSAFLENAVQARAPAGFPVARIPCGVPLPGAVPRPSAPPFHLVWTGRMIDEQKRATDTARALARALDLHPGLRVTMIGDGPALPAVRAALAAHLAAGSGRAELTGRLDPSAVAARVASAHAFVLLSDYEGLSVSLLEAMSAGLVPICLATRSGLPELVVHELNGLVVRDRETDFLHAVGRLLHDARWRDTLGAAARATVERSYSIQACAGSWLDFIDRLPRASPGVGVTAYQRPRRLTLPAHNPKLGYFDRRPPGLLRRLRDRLARLRPRR